MALCFFCIAGIHLEGWDVAARLLIGSTDHDKWPGSVHPWPGHLHAWGHVLHPLADPQGVPTAASQRAVPSPLQGPLVGLHFGVLPVHSSGGLAGNKDDRMVSNRP